MLVEHSFWSHDDHTACPLLVDNLVVHSMGDQCAQLSHLARRSEIVALPFLSLKEVPAIIVATNQKQRLKFCLQVCSEAFAGVSDGCTDRESVARLLGYEVPILFERV